MAEAADYYLTEDELRERFVECVRDYVFGPYRPQTQPGRRPVLVLVGDTAGRG